MLQQTINQSLKGVLLVLAIVGGAPASAGDVFNGRTLYDDHCIGCHGASGEGDGFTVPAFSKGNILFSLDTDILPLVESGKGIMPAFKSILSEQEILDIISYIRTLED